MNIGRNQWMVCDKCRIKWLIGENLFRSRRDKSEEIWKANAERIGDYRAVDRRSFI